jgi:hypothetical protein
LPLKGIEYINRCLCHALHHARLWT